MTDAITTPMGAAYTIRADLFGDYRVDLTGLDRTHLAAVLQVVSGACDEHNAETMHPLVRLLDGAYTDLIEAERGAS